MGNITPLIFRAYGDFKLPLYVYLSTFSIALFGLNPFSVKLVSILAGSVTPVFIFLIVKKMFPKRDDLPLLAAAITALSPWSIFLSRIALEANLFVFLFTASFYFLITQKFVTSSIFYALSLLTYNSSRVLLPFYLVILTTAIVKTKKYHPQNLPKFFLLAVAIIIFVSQSIQSSGQARYKWVSIIDQGAINNIERLRQQYPRFIINKLTYFSYHSAKNYLSHFHPQFIFQKGGSHYQFNIPDFHLINPFFFPFFIIGLVSLAKQSRKKLFSASTLILLWLIIAPIPSAITRDAPHTIRSICLFPVVSIIITLGFAALEKTKLKKITIPIFLIIITFGLFQFWQKYEDYTTDYSSSWQYGYKQAVEFAKNKYSDYQQIIITKKYGEPHEFVLFYWPWNPSDYHNQSITWDYHASWYWVDAFDKFKFINDWEIKEKTEKLTTKTLLITTPNNYNPENGQKLSTINFLDNQPAFDIISYDQQN